MPDRSKKFHEFALKSILFKGRNDWYFCYLKSERIAHVLTLLAQKTPTTTRYVFEKILPSAWELPEVIAHFAAGGGDVANVLAHIFGLLSAVRLCSTEGTLSKENMAIIAEEYERLAEKIAASGQLSPFVTADDFSVPSLPAEEAVPLLSARKTEFAAPNSIKDTKGQSPQNERSVLILDLVRKHNGLSIKDISTVITTCSEKTIQRELSLLIDRGLVRKQGERRWSQYYPT